MEADIQKNTKFNDFAQEGKENNAAISNRVSKAETYEVGKSSKHGSMLVKAVKAGIDAQLNKNVPSFKKDEANAKESSEETEEAKFYNEKDLRESEMSFKANNRNEEIKRSNVQSGNIEKKEDDKKKFEFTLGVFTPDKKTQNHPESTENNPKWPWNGAQKQEDEEKPK